MNDRFNFEDGEELALLKESWTQTTKRLQTDINSMWYERFIKPLAPISLQGGRATLSAPGKFVHEWVSARYLGTLEEILSDELGQSITIELVVEPSEKQPISAGLSSVALPPTPTADGFRPDLRFSFDSYVVGQSNRLAVAGAKAVADGPGQVYNPLFIYGPSGVGKTHLLHAIAKQILTQRNGVSLAYVSAQSFAEEFITALQNNKVDQFRRAQRSVGVWLVDDIQFVAGKDKTQEEVFHTFSYLQSLHKQIVLTSDRPPRDLQLMDERLRSRFECGLVADVLLPDTETRCAILLRKADEVGIELNHEVAMFLAENVPGNIRVLEGALTRLAAIASVDHIPISTGLASLIVEKYYRTGVLAKPAFEQILSAVGRHYKVPASEIKGASRKAPIVQARHVAIYVMREITKDSWKHIGSQFGDRDHSSMMHAHQKISEMMHQDKDLSAVIKMLIRDLYPEA